MLSATYITFAYADQPVLRSISLSLNAGEVVALLGPNGSGKSTLIRSLIGQLPAGGKIEWDDKPLAAWNRRQLARRVAYLPQLPTAEAEQTVMEVLRLGRFPYWSMLGLESEDDQKIVQQIAGEMELTDLLHRPMEQLSGGQRQRVFLGRCLVQQPAALLLDEPGTHLDLHHQLAIHQLLRTLAKQRNLAVLIASHDLNLSLAFADRVVVLREGAVVADGPPQSISAEMLSQTYAVEMVKFTSASGRAIFFPGTP